MTGFLSRRRFLGAAATSAAGLVGLRYFLPWWWRARPIVPLDELSDAARALVADVTQGVDLRRVCDMHVHLVGYGTGDDGQSWVSPDMESHWAPSRRLQFDVYKQAAGIRDVEFADEQYLTRLEALHAAGLGPLGARLMLLAFDFHVDESGGERRDRSTFHVANERVLSLAANHPGYEAAVSIHPYRQDAVERLERARRGGARAVKWLPNAMGIDPASARCDAFFEALAASGLVLISHAGLERAVHAPEFQEFGNPLRLRRALEAGVTVIVAHSGSLGRSLDLDRGTGEDGRESFELFLRMMAEPRFEGQLFGGLSATAFVNRDPSVLQQLLGARSLHERLVYASDYPLPAVDPLISTWQLAARDFLDEADRDPLEELFRANPLVFHFALLRRVRLVEGQRTLRFAPGAFESARLFA
ncbi:MAG: amidohydrolase family protein [Planctomycetota bacterium]